jgi:hypothetical protein
MPRYLLPFVLGVAILTGCATAANVDNVLSGPPKYGEKDLQRLRTFYGRPLPTGTSEAADAVRKQSKDYGALIVAATHQDRSALSTLMSLSPMDGEAGEEHGSTLTLLLSGLGDDFFSSVLKSQPRAVRQSVLSDLYWDADLKAHCPRTFRMKRSE